LIRPLIRTSSQLFHETEEITTLGRSRSPQIETRLIFSRPSSTTTQSSHLISLQTTCKNQRRVVYLARVDFSLHHKRTTFIWVIKPTNCLKQATLTPSGAIRTNKCGSRCSTRTSTISSTLLEFSKFPRSFYLL